MGVGGVYIRMARLDRLEEEKRLIWNRAIRKAAKVADEVSSSIYLNQKILALLKQPRRR